MTITRTQNDSGSLRGNASLVLRRSLADDGRTTKLEFQILRRSWNPFAKEKDRWVVKGWQSLKSVSQLAQEPIYKDFLANIFVKKAHKLEKQLNGVDLGPVAADFSRFLCKTHLVPELLLHRSGALQKSPISGVRAFAIGYHQMATAVGVYFDNHRLDKHLPALGALMGQPSNAELKQVFLWAMLAPVIVAQALEATLPCNRALKLDLRFKEKFQSSDKSVETAEGITQIKTRRAASELFTEISDRDTCEILRVLPLAYAYHELDTAADKDTTSTMRTHLAELKEMNFKRLKSGQFELLTAPVG